VASALRPQQTQPEATARTLADLWSVDPGDAKAAKEKLITIGVEAVPGLLLTLEQLTRDPLRQRYPYERDDPTGIPTRVQEDVCEILGELRAVEAVPLLIRVIERRGAPTSLLGITVEMTALERIGSPAVSALIEELKDPEPRLVELARRGDGWPATANHISLVRRRVALTLGEIGDPAAIPALQEVARTTDNAILARDLEWEIQRIREKSGK
jgi:HEAT repeat protein